MTTVVADTHALVWHLVAPRKLGKGARRAFAATDSGRWMCHVMDRLILAAARVTGSRLVTVDDSLGGYGVDVIWA